MFIVDIEEKKKKKNVK